MPAFAPVLNPPFLAGVPAMGAAVAAPEPGTVLLGTFVIVVVSATKSVGVCREIPPEVGIPWKLSECVIEAETVGASEGLPVPQLDCARIEHWLEYEGDVEADKHIWLMNLHA
jgi:hypothetical protein